MNQSDRAEQTPSVIRGESPKQGGPSGEILIDTLSVTFPVSEVERVVGGSVSGWSEDSETITERLQRFVDWLVGSSVFSVEEIAGRRNGFDNCAPLDGKSGFVAWGGNNRVFDAAGGAVDFRPERMQIYLDGVGCSRVADFSHVARRLGELVDARITRVDVAYDDHAGKTCVADCHMMYEAGLFTTNGRPPKAKFIDDMGSGEGKTFYVGRRESGKMLRCYEKGKQLGDKASSWVRWEVEIANKDREIPLDVLTDPAAFLAGAYPAALGWVSKVQQVIKTSREKMRIQFGRLMDIAKRQYGKLLHFAHQFAGLDADEVFRALVNTEDYPERLKWYLKCQVSIRQRGQIDVIAC